MTRARTYYVGWDVGGWNCDKNAKSRDAIVILHPDFSIMGKPWRGNLRVQINEAKSSEDFVLQLFAACGVTRIEPGSRVVLAIDAALGFSQAFVTLVSGNGFVNAPIELSDSNPYLHRRSELRLFRHGHRPLSPVKDMIGSQATKAMHVVSKFAPRNERCGVWSDGGGLTIIESYPAPCKKSALLNILKEKVLRSEGAHTDVEDALTSAITAYLFSERVETLASPESDVPPCEGWIWVPADCLAQS